MAAPRDQPYPQFNFLVDLGNGQTDGPEAGFQECSGLETTIDVIAYRNGNDKENRVRILSGLARAHNVTLKRGIIGSLDLYNWLNDLRNGDQHASRTVVIHLLDEQRQPVQKWTLQGARIAKYTAGPLNAKGSDLALEELTLACERIDSA